MKNIKVQISPEQLAHTQFSHGNYSARILVFGYLYAEKMLRCLKHILPTFNFCNMLCNYRNVSS